MTALRSTSDAADRSIRAIRDLMVRFVERTGAVGGAPPRRYLWTDAFAVRNLLALGEHDLAVALIDQVHRVLGRFGDGDPRRGWLSGLGDAEAAAHPTIGGLRIGKPLLERGPDEPVVERLEWDRDGQYFHYLTQWMRSLDEVASALHDPRYHAWAVELADVAHRRFTYGPLARRRMVWKMSVDLSRPQVASMGHHDPLDGLVTCLGLDASGAELADAIDDFRAMIDPSALATADPLGLGGLLVDACRLADVRVRRGLAARDTALLDAMLSGAELGLDHYAGRRELRLDLDERLAFRELGLAIGLETIFRRERGTADRFARFAPLAEHIVETWRSPAAQRSRTWREHLDIDEVMLATALTARTGARP